MSLCGSGCAYSHNYTYTHITQHVPVDAHELGELAVRFVDLACSAPETRGDGHGGEDSVVVEEQPLERFLDEHEVL